MDDFQPDDFQADDFQADDFQSDVQETGLDRAVRYAETVNKPFKWVGDKLGQATEQSGIMNNPAFTTSLPGLGLRAQGAVMGLFEKGGEALAEGLSTGVTPTPLGFLKPTHGRGIKTSPEVAAAIGTGVQMAPDIVASGFALPRGGIKPILKPVRSGLRDVAEEQTMKAAGATPSYFAAEELPRTRQMGRLLKDTGVVRPFNSTENMFTRLKNQMTTQNEAIGSALADLETAGLSGSSGREIADRIRAIKFTPSEIGPNVEGTIFETSRNNLEKAAKTAELFGDKPLPFQKLRELKAVLQDVANYDSEARGLRIPKKVAGTVRKQMETDVDRSASILGKPEISTQFKAANKNYSLLSDAEDLLSSQVGKEKAGRGGWIGDLVTTGVGGFFGGPIGAGLAYGGRKLVRNYGNQLAAYGADALAPMAEQIAKYMQILRPAQNTGRAALIQANENLLRTDPEYARLIERLAKTGHRKPKPLFRKAG